MAAGARGDGRGEVAGPPNAAAAVATPDFAALEAGRVARQGWRARKAWRVRRVRRGWHWAACPTRLAHPTCSTRLARPERPTRPKRSFARSPTAASATRRGFRAATSRRTRRSPSRRPRRSAGPGAGRVGDGGGAGGASPKPRSGRGASRSRARPAPGAAGRRVVVDGGHNPQGARALADSLADVFPGREARVRRRRAGGQGLSGHVGGGAAARRGVRVRGARQPARASRRQAGARHPLDGPGPAGLLGVREAARWLRGFGRRGGARPRAGRPRTASCARSAACTQWGR